MPIGAAVMWINARRRGERGYVVAGGTAYATVLREAGARLRIRSGDILAEDRAPLRTIVTDLDRAQVRFEIGDVVVFTTRDGATMHGSVEKLNPKRARVRCAQARWDVPYVVLRHRDESDRARGAERLVDVAKEARALMDAHGLEAVDVSLRRFAAKARACLAQPKIIEIGRWHAAHRRVAGSDRHDPSRDRARAGGSEGGTRSGLEGDCHADRCDAEARAEEGDEDRERNAAARARFCTGARVSFVGRGGRRHRGIIAKMNPKRARVVCAEGVFLAPYACSRARTVRVERPSAHRFQGLCASRDPARAGGRSFTESCINTNDEICKLTCSSAI